MRRIETLIVLLALGFYAWFLHRFGWADVLHYVRVAGWGLLLTVALEGIARLANTLGWRVTIENCPRALGFGARFVSGYLIQLKADVDPLGPPFLKSRLLRFGYGGNFLLHGAHSGCFANSVPLVVRHHSGLLGTVWLPGSTAATASPSRKTRSWARVAPRVPPCSPGCPDESGIAP